LRVQLEQLGASAVGSPLSVAGDLRRGSAVDP
jgi:hypothetical protein